jgi:hypothetical protein
MKRTYVIVILAAAVSTVALICLDGTTAAKILKRSSASGAIGSSKTGAPASALGPSLASVNGRQLIVSKRNQDGTLASPSPYVIRGANWSPAGRNTNTSKNDPNNAVVRRPEFGLWAATDIPLLKNMRVNTVRMFIDPGLDATGTAVLDQLYSNGIMVVMTVDDGINNQTRVQQAVNFYKNHPAVLAWMLGSEWNLNLYFGAASSVQDAAQRTQAAASLIKSLDSNHPVMTSYGDIDINANGLRLADTQSYVNNVCPSVDVWALNVYRGNTFGSLFDQWRAISAKPMLVGEFGTDAFRSAAQGAPVPGIVDEALQVQWNLSEWNHLFKNLSANDSTRVAIGGFVFEWNDEWWKVAPSGSQQTDGFVLPNGHPDGFANEEYFGIVDIDRHLRAVYGELATAFDSSYLPPQTTTYRAVSRGASASEYGSQNGVAWLLDNGAKLYHATGGAGGGRGFNVAAFDTCTGSLRQPVQHFDTYATRDSGAALNNLNNFLDSLPNGTLVMIAVADEAGLNNFPPNGCTHLNNPYIEPFYQRLEALGSQQIRSYCYWNSYALIAVKGEGVARSEQLGASVEASAQATLPFYSSISPGGRVFPKDGGTGSVQVAAPGGCGWVATTNDSWITITSGGSGTGNRVLNYSVGINPNTDFRAGTITIAGQVFNVIQSATASALKIDSVSPKVGRTSGGQQVKLTGAFAGLSSVMMGGVSASWSYINGGDTSMITVTTPAHTAGAVSIELVPTAGSTYSKSNAFAFLQTVFTDDMLLAGVTTTKAQHIIELRQAVDALRAVLGLAAAPWTDPVLLPLVATIKAVHIQELRTYMDDALTRLGFSTQAYTDPSLTNVNPIKRAHVEELRQRIRTIAGN